MSQEVSREEESENVPTWRDGEERKLTFGSVLIITQREKTETLLD